MTTEASLEPITLGAMTALRRSGDESDAPTVVLLHGYGGDEKVMWVFSGAVPPAATTIAFRGAWPAEGGGYRWHTGRRWPPPQAGAFAPAVELLAKAVEGSREILWIGFSQGAALALCCAAAGIPTRGIACLAGYLPAELSPLPPGLPVFWSHGRQDDRVPIAAARLGADQLRSWGLRVDFCEADTGHKVGAECLRTLRRWFGELPGNR